MKENVDRIIEITDNANDYLHAIYLDYLNNFISVKGSYGYCEEFAELFIIKETFINQ